MNSIDSLNSSLFFSAAAAASREAQKNQDKSKLSKTKKTAFSSMVEKSQEMESLASAGLPVEIAGLSVEDAVNFLKDAVDIAAEKLEENMSSENFQKFRKSVGQFLKYVQKNNYEIKTKKRFGERHIKTVFFEEKRKKDPYVQIHVIDQELDKLAAMLMQKHGDEIQFMSKVDEIKGLLVDFLAV